MHCKRKEYLYGCWKIADCSKEKIQNVRYTRLTKIQPKYKIARNATKCTKYKIALTNSLETAIVRKNAGGKAAGSERKRRRRNVFLFLLKKELHGPETSSQMTALFCASGRDKKSFVFHTGTGALSTVRSLETRVPCR